MYALNHLHQVSRLDSPLIFHLGLADHLYDKLKVVLWLFVTKALGITSIVDYFREKSRGMLKCSLILFL